MIARCSYDLLTRNKFVMSYASCYEGNQKNIVIRVSTALDISLLVLHKP